MRAKNADQDTPLWRHLAVSLSLVVVLFISALFVAILISNQEATQLEPRSRARALLKSIVLTRRWSAKHGGVFVVKTPGMQSNPYLKKPDIKAADGTVYTKKYADVVPRYDRQ